MDPPAPSEREREQPAVSGGAFASALASGELDVHQLIVDTMAEAVAARQASLAVYDDRNEGLLIKATYGYPAALVSHVLIASGTGVIGRTFETRRARLVADVAREPTGHRPRLRYRTGSFMSVPLIAADEVVGVVTVTDRADERPFSHADLKTVQGLVAPAALALSRARLADAKSQLEHAAGVDPLTGLFNRRYFNTRLQEEIGRARRHQDQVALLAIDVDRAHSRFPGHALTPTGVMAIRCKQFHRPDL